MADFNWRTVNVDRYDPESSVNFDLNTLTPGLVPTSAEEVQSLANQIRQLSRGGDTEGALRGALENPPYGADDKGKDIHVHTVTEILQSIRQAEMTPMLQRIYGSEGGPELCDVLMKYLYKGMASTTPSQKPAPKQMTPQTTGFSQMQSRTTGESQGHGMSVLLSWHEKLIEIAGPGSIVRVMSDRRTV